jgi:hypothetical protein
MQITFESNEETLKVNIANNKLLGIRGDSDLRNLGRYLIGEINKMKPEGYNIYVKLRDQNQDYEGLIYTPTRFLSKIRKAVEADKYCACGRFIYCACHETCTKCNPCEVATKTMGALDRFVNRIYECSIYQITKYDDVNELKDRGG